MKKNTELLKKLVSELFNLMGSNAAFGVSYDKEAQAFMINIDAGEETGLLIGRKGENLLSIQTVLGLLFKGQTGEWARILVNVGDYKEKEEEYLRKIASSAANRVRETGEAQPLYNLKPSQRRIVHMFLAGESDIVSESEGEGRDRYLIIRPK